MAIGTGTFKTPVGRTYEVAPQIQQQFDRTANVIYGAMQRESDRLKEQEQLFGQLYSNLGEIEGRLQEQYNGLNQQAIDATREYMKQHYAKGGRATDPEFMSDLGQKVGRIRASMTNADNIRKQIDTQVKELANNPYMDYESKNRAVTEMLQMAANPDVLISKNPIDFSQITQKYINPDFVFKEAYLSLPSMGETETVFNNERGDELSRTVVLNDLIDPNNPFDDQGRPNVQLDPARAFEIIKNNPIVAQQTERIRRERYGNEPVDIGTAKALRDGFMAVAPLTQKTRVRRTADQIAKEQAAINRQNTLTDLAISREARLAKKEEQSDQDYAEINDRWQRFNQAYNQGELGFLGEYENLTPNQKGFKWATNKDIVSSKENWDNATPEEREKTATELGITVPETGMWWWKSKDSKSQSLYDKVVEEMNKKPTERTGLVWFEKTGTGKDATFEPREMPIESEDDLERAFRTLENLRKKGKVPETVIPETSSAESQQARPGGINLNASQRIKP